MILSMTGWASRNFQWNGHSFRVELKSLNHRFLDQKYRIPREWVFVETALRPLVEAQIKRGSVEIWIDRQEDQSTENSTRINTEAAQQAFETLDQLSKKLGLKESVCLRDVLNFPEVFERNPERNSVKNVLFKEASAQESFLQTLLPEFSLALKELNKMKQIEGEKLVSVLSQALNKMKASMINLKRMRDQIRTRAQEKIKKRVEQAVETFPIPATAGDVTWAMKFLESRVAQETAMMLERLDVEEELVRFSGHILELEKLLNTSSIGKKMDFMLQEVNREINTLSNKSQDLGISQEVVDLKLLVEQLREQSLNLE